MKQFLNWNGKIIEPHDLRISADNRGFRYGDGIFETMKAVRGKILLKTLHFERLFSSAAIMQFQLPLEFTLEYFESRILELLTVNGHLNIARIRFMMYRGESTVTGMPVDKPEFLIQSWPLPSDFVCKQMQHVRIDIFPDARKSYDMFANLKSNNYLSYLMAASFAKKQNLDDAIVLNSYGRIADSSIANLFLIKNGIIKTPTLTEGCVNGVYRRYLLQTFAEKKILCEEVPVTTGMLLEADEVFLTNAITEIRCVSQCGESTYGDKKTLELFEQLRAIAKL